jgi:hypothetical protein
MKQRAVMEVQKAENVPETDIRERINLVVRRKEKTSVLLDVWLHVFLMARLNRYLNLSDKQRSART